MKTISTPLAFNEMSLSPEILRAISDIGYTKPTNIQAHAIPLLLDGHDLIGRSSTGSGKTLAFGAPAIDAVDVSARCAQVLILSPTRELAMQIHAELEKFGKHKRGLNLAVVYGGSSMSAQIKQLREAHVVIGTPGRLMDHMRRKTLKLETVHTVVLDEADEMLNMGFIEDIETILREVPLDRQTMLFSATMPEAIRTISDTFLIEPKTVEMLVGKENQADIEQTFFQVPHAKKKDALMLLLHTNEQRSIVFCNTKAMVDELAELMMKQGLNAAALHGDMSQDARSKVMRSFRAGNVHTLIATDVAARGIDVDDVDVVINYDLPQTFEYYVHRIGRTGRAGMRGVSQTLISNRRHYETLLALMKFTGKPIEERKLPTSASIMEKAVERTVSKVRNNASDQQGIAAQKLVDNLLNDVNFGGSPRRVALALAELLIGGDEQFERFDTAVDFKKKQAHKGATKPSRGGASAGRRSRAKELSRNNSREQQGRKTKGSAKRDNKNSFHKAKRQRSRAGN